MIILTGTPDLGHPSSGKGEASIRNSQPPRRQEGQRNGSFRGKPLKSLTAPSRELRFVTGRAGTADPLRPWRHHRKGTGHYLGPNLVMLRGHAFNSSAAPPLGSRLSASGFLSPALCLQARLLSPLSPLSVLSPRLNGLGRLYRLNGLPFPLPAAGCLLPSRPSLVVGGIRTRDAGPTRS